MLSKSSKPMFYVGINMAGCLYKIRINDIPIFSDAPPGLAMNTTWPVNEWMRSGANSIILEITPLKDAKDYVKMGQACKANAGLLVRSWGSPKDVYTTIAKISYQSEADNIVADVKNTSNNTPSVRLNSSRHFEQDNNGDVEVQPLKIEKIAGKYGEGVKLTMTVNMKVPFPEWKWLISDKIPDNEITKNELIAQYQNIWLALHGKNVRLIAPLFKERIKEYNAAYYGATGDSVLDSLNKCTHDNSIELGDFIPKYEYLKIIGDGRLANLTIWDGSEAIYFNYKDGSASENYDITFRKKGDKWIITR